MTKSPLLVIAALLLALSPVAAQSDEAPYRVYERGRFRIVYQTAGRAMAPATDRNDNGVPDRVENIAIQLEAARELFHDAYGFPDPLASPRYGGKAQSVEVIVRAKGDMGGNRGTAFSAVTRSHVDPAVMTLRLHVASDADPRRNLTPAHEYFHLIQYGITAFRNRWLLEGTARWAEDGLAMITTYHRRNLAAMLEDPARLERLFRESYSADGSLWHPLAVACGRKARIPHELLRKYRYVDGTPVFQDGIFYGPDALRRVLLCLPDKEAEAARAFGGKKQWMQKGQRSETNNPFILQCVREVLEQGRQ